LSATGERIGEFKLQAGGEAASGELLRQTSTGEYSPALADIHELTFKTAAVRADLPAPRPKREKAVPVPIAPGNVPLWAPHRTLQSLRAVRERFNESRQALLGLLEEANAAVKAATEAIPPGMIKKVYNDGMALAREQEACIKAVQEIDGALARKSQAK
jgi:hypothetical protein